jgi:hypothetical protein
MGKPIGVKKKASLAGCLSFAKLDPPARYCAVDTKSVDPRIYFLNAYNPSLLISANVPS